MNETILEIRCSKCGKLLGRVQNHSVGEIEMKCPKCKEVDVYLLNTD